MDKMKILVVGGGPDSRFLQHLLEQYKDLYEVERIDFESLPVRGKGPYSALVDEEILIMDFSQLELRALAHMDNKQHMLGNVRTGRLIRAFPELQELSKPADHPSNKHKPKGPRGPWGKL